MSELSQHKELSKMITQQWNFCFFWSFRKQSNSSVDTTGLPKSAFTRDSCRHTTHVLWKMRSLVWTISQLLFQTENEQNHFFVAEQLCFGWYAIKNSQPTPAAAFSWRNRRTGVAETNKAWGHSLHDRFPLGTATSWRNCSPIMLANTGWRRVAGKVAFQMTEWKVLLV